MIMAMPWPPPTHMVSSPIVWSRVRRSFSSVARIRTPVMPNGWPSAIAPPCGFSLSLNGSTPIPLADGMTWAAKASLISTTSTSSMVIPARASACRLDSIGPRPISSGSRAVTPVARMRAIGVIPSSAARAADITTAAAAPSLSGHEFPAVTHVQAAFGVAGPQQLLVVLRMVSLLRPVRAGRPSAVRAAPA